MATNADKAREFWDRARQQLMEVLNSGNPRAFHGGIDRFKFQHRSPIAQAPQGLSLKAGRTPNDAEVQQYIDEVLGGNPYAKRGQPMGYQPRTPVQNVSQGIQNPPTPNPQDALTQQLFAAAQGQMDEANRQNQLRYDEGHGELTGLRTRNQERVTNWGNVQEALNAERAAEALDSQRAMLAASGIANSNVLPTYAARNARDLALVQQDVSERRDARASEYDTRDTNNLVGFVERRDDVGPDVNALLEMAMRYGATRPTESQTNKSQSRGNRGTRGRGRSGIPLVPGPQGGMRSPMMLGLGDLGISMPSVGFAPRPVTYTPRTRPMNSVRQATRAAAVPALPATGLAGAAGGLLGAAGLAAMNRLPLYR